MANERSDERNETVKVLDRVGPGAAELGQYLKRHIPYIVGKGFEWLEDPKHIAAIIRNRSKMGAKPQSSPGSKDLAKTGPEALDELEEMEAKLYQQDTGISIYMSSGRFDMQFCVKRLGEIMTKPRKMGNLWFCKAGEISGGYTDAHTQIRSSRVRRYCENSRRLRLGWQRGTLLHTCRAGIPWRTSRGLVGCIRSSAGVPGKQNSTESWMVLHEESSQNTCTKKWDETSISTSTRTGRQRLGCVPERALERPDTYKFVGCGSKMPYVTKLFA